MTENIEFKATLKQFEDYLFMISKIYRDLIPALKQELETIRKDDITALNESMKTQQALLFQTRNFESKVNDFQSKLGIEAHNLSEMIQQLPEQYQLSFFEILSQFDQISTEVRFYQDKCRTLLQSKLYLIDKSLSKTNTPKNNTYNKDAAEVHGSMFSKTMEVKI